MQSQQSLVHFKMLNLLVSTKQRSPPDVRESINIESGSVFDGAHGGGSNAGILAAIVGEHAGDIEVGHYFTIHSHILANLHPKEAKNYI